MQPSVPTNQNLNPSIFPMSVYQQSILNTMDSLSRDNTKLAYDPKAEEFKKFCHHIYGMEGQEYCEVVTEEKMYMFLLYQAHRDKRKRGKTSANRDNQHGFNSSDYDSVMGNLSSFDLNRPGQMIGFQALIQYYSAVLKLLDSQTFNRLTREQARSARVKQLLSMVSVPNQVKQRKVTLSKRNYEEKIESDIFGYTQVHAIPVVELALFERNAFSHHTCQCALRDRYCFLMSFCGILRGESLFLCELSDLFDVQYKTPGISSI